MLQINSLTYAAWGRQFLDNATVALPPNSRIGLVGRNGIGKSTLFRLILGELAANGDEVQLPRGSRVASVDQEHPATPVSVLDTILEADVERHRLMQALETATPEEMGDIWGRLNEIGADAAPAKASEILSGLGFSQQDLARPMAHFSGGWRMRVALAAALFAEPDLLLLDEPTNYLDLEGVLWLEGRLKRYPHTAVIISHDRDLLDTVCTHILHLSNRKLLLYPGNYTDFERVRAERLRTLEATRSRQESERAHLQSFVDRFRAKASKAVQAQSRLKRLAKLEPVELPPEERVTPFILPSPERKLPSPLIRIDGGAIGYTPGKPVLSGIDLNIDADDRIGILGVNGAGKSTFAKLIAEALPLLAGELTRDGRLRVGWFHQHQIEAMDPEDTPLSILRAKLPEASESSLRSRLAQFGLAFEKQDTKTASLSGGERARLLVSLVAMDAPHVLILDEPTNHLDIDSRRALLDALNSYDGAVLLVTHDRSLMELVADRLLLVADGKIRPFEGDMDDYARFVLDRAKAASRPEKTPPPPPPTKRAGGPSLSTLRFTARKAEERMAEIQSAIARIDRDLVNTPDHARLAALGAERDALTEKLALAEAEWLAAEEALTEV